MKGDFTRTRVRRKEYEGVRMQQGRVQLDADWGTPEDIRRRRRRATAKGTGSALLAAVVLVLLSVPLGPLPPIGGLTNPGGGIWDVAEQAVHPTRMDLVLPDLSGTVTVSRDTFGIPHIFATSEDDLFFAQGFLHAQDRLWQMDLTRRAAEGKLAELLGAKVGSLEALEVDTFVRTIGIPNLAATFTSEADPSDPSPHVLAAYAKGVNAFLRTAGPRGLPLEFRLLNYAPAPWTSEDSVAIGLLIAWSLSGSFEDLELSLLAAGIGLDAVNELFPIDGPFQRPVDPRPGTRGGGPSFGPGFAEAARDVLVRSRALEALTGGPMLGSNNWAVAWNRTDTRASRLANDPHLSLQMPAVWYENHLVGGPFDVYGVSFPGIPTVILGQNRFLAWGATNVGADVVDLYRETIDGDRYLHRGAWKDLDVRTETIRVKGGAPVTVTVKTTVHGPLVTERGQTLAMRWTGQDAGGLLRTFYAIDKARDWPEFREALRPFAAPAQNFVYADVHGTIAMRSNGFYPLRLGFDGRFPLDGASGASDWTGFVDFEAYPESVDPAEGYVLSANQQPQYPGYPHYLGWSWDPGYRTRRIAEMLAADERVTEDDLRAMQLDTLDVMAREFRPFVLRAVTGSCTTSPCSLALAELAAWDFRTDADRAAPAIWWRFANALRDEMFHDEWEAAGVGDLRRPLPNVMERLFKLDPNSRWFDDVRTPTVRETWQDVVRRAFGSALDRLAADLGDVSAWRWGAVHVRQLDHLTGLVALGRGPYPASGDALTVNVASGEVVKSGPSWRLLADLSDLRRSKGVYPGGQSANPLSPHYDDLLPLWLAGDYHDVLLPTRREDMPPERTESTLVLRRA